MRNWMIAGIGLLCLLAIGLGGLGRAQLAAQTQRPQAFRPTIRIPELTADEQKDLAAARQNAVRQRITSLVSRLPKVQFDMEKVNASKVPVMLPLQEIKDLRVFHPSALHYAATGSQPGYQFELHGTRQTFTGPVQKLAELKVARPPAPTINGFANLRTEKSEVGMEVTWTRYGAYYHLTVTCDDPDHDPRCTPAGATAIALAHTYVGGGE